MVDNCIDHLTAIAAVHDMHEKKKPAEAGLIPLIQS